MKRILIIASIALLTGCASIQSTVQPLVDMIPSFWDDNQAKAAIDIKHKIDKLDCTGNYASQVGGINDSISWFISYSEAKKTKDVIKLVTPLKETVEDFARKAEKNDVSATYCNLKKKVMITQSTRFSQAVLRRF